MDAGLILNAWSLLSAAVSNDTDLGFAVVMSLEKNIFAFWPELGPQKAVLDETAAVRNLSTSRTFWNGSWGRMTNSRAPGGGFNSGVFFARGRGREDP